MNRQRTMNYTFAPAPAANYARPLTSAAANSGALFTRFWGVFLLVVIVFVAIVIYYKTVGYYLELSWDRIYGMIRGRDSVSMSIGSEAGVDAALKPMDPVALPLGAAGGESSSLLSSLSAPRKEVYNVSRNIYTYADAAAVCGAFGGELASYEQVKEAHSKGADWCNYGWSKGQMALFPTQKETWEKLQAGAPEYRSACGRPGVNGGYFDNPELRFGVNCYGVKPPQSATDELLESEVALPQSAEEIEFEKKIQKFRDQLHTSTVLPFRHGQWAE